MLCHAKPYHFQLVEFLCNTEHTGTLSPFHFPSISHISQHIHFFKVNVHRVHLSLFWFKNDLFYFIVCADIISNVWTMSNARLPYYFPSTSINSSNKICNYRCLFDLKCNIIYRKLHQFHSIRFRCRVCWTSNGNWPSWFSHRVFRSNSLMRRVEVQFLCSFVFVTNNGISLIGQTTLSSFCKIIINCCKVNYGHAFFFIFKNSFITIKQIDINK